MKFLLTVCFVATLAAVSANTSGLLGSDDYDNYLMIDERIQHPHRRWPHSPQTAFVTFTTSGTIRGISIVDNLFGSGAEFRVSSGGVGFSTLSMELTETGYGIDTNIKFNLKSPPDPVDDPLDPIC